MLKKYYNVLIFFLIFSGAILFFAQNTYSKYKDDVDGTTNIQIARWNIIVNNESIANKTSLTNNIQATFPGTDYISPGVVAPGSEGYYDIVIQSRNVDVAFNYKLNASLDPNSGISDLVITGYTIDPVEPMENNVTEEYTGEITGDVPLGKIITTIRVYIKWDDSPTNTMDNIADTNAVIDSSTVALFINNLEFNQIK